MVNSLLREQWEQNYLANKRWIVARDDAMRNAVEGRYEKQGPALVVGAGPSISKNISDIDDSLYIIYACDKMVPRLAERGIMPNTICALNAAKTDVRKWIEPANKRGTRLIVPCGVHPETYEGWEGELIFINAVTPSGLHERVKNECSYRDVIIGSNVGTFCYTMAVYFGHNPIAYAGLDFCFAQREDVMNKYQGGKWYNIIEIADINGNTRWLDLAWWDMAGAFQEKARDYQQFYGVRTINCTEGGINYTQYVGKMELKEFNLMIKEGRDEVSDNGCGDARDSLS